MKHLYIGLMSGTSMDGIDVALVNFENKHPKLIDFCTHPYPKELVPELHALCQPGDDEINRMARADRQVGRAFAEATLAVLKKNRLSASQIMAIGSHGQTIRHHPQGEDGFSLQIGDADTIATSTGIDVVANFRKKDVALGGQGAPLVPAFHSAVFAAADSNIAVLNIGGIANVTYLSSSQQVHIQGLDTGPGNTLMDAWCMKHTGKPFDKDGQWAAKGTPSQALLTKLMTHPYLQQPTPKSTGREVFHMSWLEQQLSELNIKLSAEDVQATLLQFTVDSIVNELNRLPAIQGLYVCGGGALNGRLMALLAQSLPNSTVSTTDALGVDINAVEAMAFAWLAYAYHSHIHGNVPSVTGASRPAVLGTLHPHN